MADIRRFITDNGIRQADLARFLGITAASVSKMVKGITQPSKENLRKMRENGKGWDTSALDKDGSGSHGREEELRYLRLRVEELSRENRHYWEIIQGLLGDRKDCK